MADPPRLDIYRRPVDSSSLAELGYDKEHQVLAVAFKNGSVFYYYDVSVAAWEKLSEAESKGRVYSREIKGVYRSERVDGRCPKCGAVGIVDLLCQDCGCADVAPLERRYGEPGDAAV